MNILATQQKFDKDIPVVFGNAEYNTECELLIAIDEIIRQSGIEKMVMKYFLDAARVNKMIAAFGTDKPTRLTTDEIIRVKENAILALRASVLRNPMRQKGFEHREIHMVLSVLSHNLWVLARLKLAQEAKLKQAA